MSLLIITLIFLSGLGAIYFGYLGFKNYRQITVTNERVRFTRILIISIQYGLAFAMVFFAFFMIVGIIDVDHHWSAKSFVSSLTVSIVAGIITFLGSLYQVYTTSKYRGLIIKSLRKKE